MPDWKYSSGDPIACTEKIHVLNENYNEIKQLLQDALDDAVLLGCSEVEIKQIFVDLINSTQGQYTNR